MAHQRVFNDLQRTRLACGRMIWFLPNLPSPVSRLDRRHKGLRDNLLTGAGGERGWARSRIIRPQESLSSINHSILSGAHSSFAVILSGSNTWIHDLILSVLYIVPMETGG
jgi:hypothetical protein